MAGNLNLVVCEDADAVAGKAARIFADLIRPKPDAVLGLATGSTPLGICAELVRMHREEDLSFARVTTFNLDEYWGLDGDHDQSYRHTMQKNLFEQIDIRPWNTHVLNGRAADPNLECRAFETQILSAGGIDLWLLGIGTNGHIAFNEPGSPVDSHTRLVNLSRSTIETNSDGRTFKHPDEVPRRALSVGIGTIREARQILLLATGPKKAAAIAAAIEGPFTTDCPASLLQGHPDCTWIVDKVAAADLKHNPGAIS